MDDMQVDDVVAAAAAADASYSCSSLTENNTAHSLLPLVLQQVESHRYYSQFACSFEYD